MDTNKMKPLKFKKIGMAWIHKDGAVWEFNADKDREETLGMDYVPVYVTTSSPLDQNEEESD